jgi:pyridoxamine 5'-phosphate oxidase
MLNLNALRQEYRLKALDISDLDPNPLMQFKHWFQDAQNAQIPEVNAMALATSSSEGRPSCRMVLLKKIDHQEFIFFTNRQSRKGRDLAVNPYACATFYWHGLERQIILDGGIIPLAQEEAEAYFDSRPRGSQLGSWASHQDQPLTSREELEKAYRHYEEKFADGPIPMPSYWGGYCLKPDHFEFWQGRANRLHDRFRYLLIEDKWLISRLAP